MSGPASAAGSIQPPLPSDFLQRCAQVALNNLRTEYPFHVVHLARDAGDLQSPRALHPAFGASYDWHSCVHMTWTLARVLRLTPASPLAAAAIAQLDRQLTDAHLAAECAYMAAAGRASFERPYGWGWLLRLSAELDYLRIVVPQAAAWSDAVRPLAMLLAARWTLQLPRQDYPVRTGTHGNSAFAMLLALPWAAASAVVNEAEPADDRAQRRALHGALSDAARRWFAHDRRYPAEYEPGGDDFLSGGLCEAALMRRLLPKDAWSAWWSTFRPDDRALARWLAPATVADAQDAKTVHLHGLNLSRVACWHALAPDLDPTLRATVQDASARHLAHSLPAVTEGDYVGTHWLASFALLALTEPAL